jgi:hypothetical protein
MPALNKFHRTVNLFANGVEVASIIAYRVPRSESTNGPESPRYAGIG